jgi:hypothetical protein
MSTNNYIFIRLIAEWESKIEPSQSWVYKFVYNPGHKLHPPHCQEPDMGDDVAMTMLSQVNPGQALVGISFDDITEWKIITPVAAFPRPWAHVTLDEMVYDLYDFEDSRHHNLPVTVVTINGIPIFDHSMLDGEIKNLLKFWTDMRMKQFRTHTHE